MSPAPRGGRRAAILTAGLVLLAGAAAPIPASAQGAGDAPARDYRSCMKMVERDPDSAFEKALDMQDMGGGPPARHCAAAALAALGHHAEAAERFVALAREMPDHAPAETVADILAHAGLSWLSAGKPARAEAALTEALKLTPERPVILTDRAVARADLGRFWEAIDDLNRALQLDPGRVDALALRASAYRQVEVYELALENANRALERDPDNPDALLERGIVHRLQERDGAARRDWIRVIKKHPDTPEARMARKNLDKLDFGPSDEGTAAGDGG